MTGNYTITTSPRNLTGCAYLNSKVYDVDFRKTMRDFLSESKQPLTQKRLYQAEKLLKTEIEKYLPQYPKLVDTDGGIISVTIVEGVKEGTIFGSFRIVSHDKKTGIIAEEAFHLIQNNESEFENAHITTKADCLAISKSAAGRKYLSVDALKTFDEAIAARPTVGQTRKKDAVEMVREIISSTITISKNLPKLECKVGGPIKMFDLNDQKVMQLN